MDFLLFAFEWLQQNLYESVVQPLALAFGQDPLLDKAFEGTGWLVAGVLQIVCMLLVIGPLERLRPVEPVSDRAAVRVDILYTLVHRLGLFKLLMFFTLEDWFQQAIGLLRAQGLPTWHLDQLWPGVTDQALVSFVLYLVVFDAVHYLLHRAQHQFGWWWSLHSLHHSQRQMTMWTDNRNHLLDDIITSLVLAGAALLIGVGPGQFVMLVALGQLSESLQHANVRFDFGRLLSRLWISPCFHRRHHAIGIGHETPAGAPLGGCNFGVLLPWWDMLLGTADFRREYAATGVRDQVEQGRDYGRGFWAQQKLGLLRLIGRA